MPENMKTNGYLNTENVKTTGCLNTDNAKTTGCLNTDNAKTTGCLNTDNVKKSYGQEPEELKCKPCTALNSHTDTDYGHVCNDDYEHACEHNHGHGHGHEHEHTHEAGHGHEHIHEAGHGHTCEHEHGHGHEHEHEHGSGCGHEYRNDHKDGHEHGNGCRHDHSHGDEHVKMPAGFKLLECHEHEGAAVCSFEKETTGDAEKIEKDFRLGIELLRNRLNESGAVIGHIKGYVRHTGNIMTFSTTGGEITALTHESKGACISFASIVFGTDTQELKALVTEIFAENTK